MQRYPMQQPPMKVYSMQGPPILEYSAQRPPMQQPPMQRPPMQQPPMQGYTMQKNSNPANFINYYSKKLYDISKNLNNKSSTSWGINSLGAANNVTVLFKNVGKIYDKYYNEEGLTEEDKQKFIQKVIDIRDDISNAKNYLKHLNVSSNRIQLLEEFKQVRKDCINNVAPPSQGGAARRRRKASRRYKKTGGKKRGSRRTRRRTQKGTQDSGVASANPSKNFILAIL